MVAALMGVTISHPLTLLLFQDTIQTVVEEKREVNGQRSGIPGEGPRARSIREDQLALRRDEAKRIGELKRQVPFKHKLAS